jgi:hypothetical protein
MKTAVWVTEALSPFIRMEFYALPHAQDTSANLSVAGAYGRFTKVWWNILIHMGKGKLCSISGQVLDDLPILINQ